MAGLLGGIFSAGNVAKRKLTDLLGNPVLSAQQMLGNLNDRARVLNQMTAAAAKEGVAEYGPETRKLAGLLADAYNPIGMTVYHGSPAKFTKFDPTKIGSGEGAQAYGYGHYVAESPSVAREYQKNLANPIKDQTDTAFITARTAFVKGDGDVKKAMKYLDQQQKMTEEASGFLVDKGQKSLSDIEQARGLLKSGAMQPGNMYEIDLPDEQIAKMLDWDKPLSQQPEKVRIALEQFGYKINKKEVDDYSDALLDALTNPSATGELPKQPLDMSGESIYRKLKQSYANNERLNAERDALISKYQKEGMSWSDSVRAMSKEDRAKFVDIASQIESQKDASAMTSEALRQAGVPGIRYLDQGSRGAGEGTSNFVVFPGNEDMLTILKRNGGLLGP